jgi:hypothetical protein
MTNRITVPVVISRDAAVVAGSTTYGLAEYVPTPEQWSSASLAQRTRLASLTGSQMLTLAGTEVTWEAILVACNAWEAKDAALREEEIRLALSYGDEDWFRRSRREVDPPSAVRKYPDDPRLQARLAEAEVVAAANRDAYVTGLLDGSVPWPTDVYARPQRVVFMEHERSDDLEKEYLRRYHANEAEVIAFRKRAEREKAEREAAIAAELKEWALTSGDENLELAAAEDYTVLGGVANLIVQRIIDAVDREPEAVLVVGTTREDESTWDERPDPRAKAIREQKRISAACDELPVLPKRTEIEVSRVMRAAIAPERSRNQQDDDECGPNKVTACIITLRHPALATRHLVFALE